MTNITAPTAQILIVDDNEINLQIEEALLSEFGVNVTTALSGFQCLEILADSKRYDIIYLDYLMPEMDGLDVIAHIQNMGLSYKPVIIALSAEETNDAKNMFMQAGFDDYMTKPVSSDSFAKSLMTHLPPNKILRTAIADDENITIPDDAPLPDIDGNGQIPTDAIQLCGGFESWLSVVKTFRRNIPNKAQHIAKLLADNNIKDWTTEVHSLKSSARIIGADSLSELSTELEALGKAQQTNPSDELLAKIIRLTDLLLSKYENLISVLHDIAHYEMSHNSITMNHSQFIDIIKRMRTAAESQELSIIDECASLLRDAVLPSELQTLRDEICEAADDIDFDRLMNLIEFV